jgi:tetratricopeptide (TPR) repeat protein
VAALPAVQLFVERARSVRRDFTLTGDNAGAVADICRRLDGLPLAIELAAARIRLLDPAALLARLGNRLDALGTGPVDLPEHQRTLRATVEWSVDLLADDERTMLATLAVFVDGWSIEAATDVADLAEDQALDRLDALAGHSLLQVTPGAEGPRFRMLEAVREFAAELLAATPDRRAAVEQRHAEHFQHVVEDADLPLRGAEQMASAERLQVDEGNLRLAVRWFFDHDPAALPHLFRILWLFWQQRDHMIEGRAWVEELQQRPEATGWDDLAQTELAIAAAVSAIEVGDDDGALDAIARLERLEDRIVDPYLAGSAQLMRAWTLPIVGDYDEALASAARALDGFRKQDEPFMTASAVMTMGMLEASVGDHDAARRHLAELEALGALLVNNWFTSSARVQLVPMLVEAGNLAETRALLDEALDPGADVELSTHTVTFYVVAYAQLALEEGDAQRAAVALGAAEGLRARAGLRVWPSMRRSEAELLARVEAALDPAVFKEAFASGAALSRREAVAVVRGDRPPAAG